MKKNIRKYILILLLALNISLNDCTKIFAKNIGLTKTNSSLGQTLGKTIQKTKKNNKNITKNKKLSSKINKNGDISDQIQISEIFPDPSGNDKNKEWLELSNSSNKNIKLGNWQIIIFDSQNPNKKAKISTLTGALSINSNSLLTLSDSQLKISLPNQNAKIELKDPDGKIIDSISYEKAETNSSLSRIKVIQGQQSKIINNWGNLTKNAPNPVFYEISGIILSKTGNTDKILENFIEILSNNNQKLKISIPKNKKFENIEMLLQTNTTVDILITKSDNNSYELINFKIQNTKPLNSQKQQTNENWLYYLLTMSTILLVLLNQILKLHSIKDKLSNVSTS